MKKLINAALFVAVISFSATAQQTTTSTNKTTTTGTTVNTATRPATPTQSSTGVSGNMSTNPAANQTQSTTADPIVNMDQYDYTVQQYYDRMDMDRFGNYKLNEQQRQQYNTINTDYNNSMNSLSSTSGMTSDQLRAKRYQIRNARRDKYLAILSPADRASYQSYLDDWNNNYISMDELRSRLTLTDDQYKKINELNNSYTTREAAVINNQALADADRNSQLNAISKERYEMFRTLLSADQITKLEHKNNGTWKIKTQNGDEKKKIKTRPASAKM